MGWFNYKPYVSVAERQAKAARHTAALAKKTGRSCSPVKLGGRAIATTFWGKAWCDNLESYSDFSNRMPRGRTYVRNGSVVDLCIEPGLVTALVSGSSIYKIEVKIKPLDATAWTGIKQKCAGQIGSLVELLQGKLSKGVMEIITRRDGGLFPKPVEITKRCSCPDWADMCKHVAAALYGVGSRLDLQPELLFVLRKVDHMDLIAAAGKADPLRVGSTGSRKTIAAGALGEVFGIELAGTDQPAPSSGSAKSGGAVSGGGKTSNGSSRATAKHVVARPKPPAKRKAKQVTTSQPVAAAEPRPRGKRPAPAKASRAKRALR